MESCREMTPGWDCLPGAQDIILRKTFETVAQKRDSNNMKRVGLNTQFYLISSTLLPFNETKKHFQETWAAAAAGPMVGRLRFQRKAWFVIWNDLDHLPEVLVEECSLIPGTKATDQISAFWIKWEERVVRSVQLAFLTARSPVFTGNQADVKHSLCKYYPPAFPALLYSSSWRRDSSRLAASRKID